MNRRHFLTSGTALTALLVTGNGFGKSYSTSHRSIRLHNAHTGEKIKADYWINGEYIPEVLAEIDLVLRDHHRNEVFSMDPRIIDFISRVNQVMEIGGQETLIYSAYRSPETNNSMRFRRRYTGVAKNSFHIIGKAVDLHLEGKDNRQVARAARQLQLGGVGSYSHFVHLDTGNTRFWKR